MKKNLYIAEFTNGHFFSGKKYNEFFAMLHRYNTKRNANLAVVPHLNRDEKFSIKVVGTDFNMINDFIENPFIKEMYKVKCYTSDIFPGDQCLIVKRKQMSTHSITKGKLLKRIQELVELKKNPYTLLENRISKMIEILNVKKMDDVTDVVFMKIRDAVEIREKTAFVKISSVSTGQNTIYLTFKVEPFTLTELNFEDCFKVNGYGLSNDTDVFALPVSLLG